VNHITDHSRGGGGGGGGVQQQQQQQQGIMIPLSTGCEDHWSWNINDKSDEVGLLFQFILLYIYQIFSTNYSL
jgi:hypothetical protein